MIGNWFVLGSREELEALCHQRCQFVTIGGNIERDPMLAFGPSRKPIVPRAELAIYAPIMFESAPQVRGLLVSRMKAFSAISILRFLAHDLSDYFE